MVVCLFAHPEPDRDTVEEQNIAVSQPRTAKVVARKEDQFIGPDLELLLRQDRLIRPPISIRHRLSDFPMRIARHPIERNPNTLRRAPPRRVQNMRR